MSQETMVIFGISSFVGSNLGEFFKDKLRVIGTYDKTPHKSDGILSMPCDVMHKDEIRRIITTFQPDYVVYCIGVSSLENAHNYPKVADALNTAGIFNVTNFTERYQSKFFLISSAFLFGGENNLYAETDIPMSNNAYGTSLASSEFYIQKSCLNYVIIRCCKLYGRSFKSGDMNIFEKIERKLYKNEKYKLDSKVVLGWLDVQYLAEMINLCILRKISNRLLQLSSNDFDTHYGFAKRLASKFDYNDASLIKSSWDFPLQRSFGGGHQEDDKMYFMMDTLNLEYSLEVAIPTIDQSLSRTKRLLDPNNVSSKKSTTSGSAKFI
jgi:dTDP-4-dehydrorhamnose reductase